MPADLQRFREAGMDGCLTKPISLTDLKMALSEGPTSRTKHRQGSHTTIDLDRLQELRDSLGETGLARILTRFHADFDNLQKRLTKACADDPSQILALCHEAAGLSAVVGAKALHAHFAKAEALCRDGHAETAARLLLDETDALWTNVQMTLTQNA
jgi:HPt (histidine-containing phosphotransfer) domain-containing protein